jgi:hypothetical protein
MIPVTTKILAFVMARLVAVTGLPEGQIHGTSVAQTDTSVLPDVLVFAVLDQPHGEAETDFNGSQTRSVAFAIDLTVVGIDTAATDPLAILARQAVLSDPTLGGLALDTVWSGQEWGEGGSATALVFTKLTFTARYHWSPEW